MLQINPMSVLAFSTWLGKQPSDLEYNYKDAFRCAIHGYLKSLYPESRVVVLPDCYIVGVGFPERLPEHFNKIASGPLGNGRRWTYGEAYKRSLAVLEAA